jgi:hypothetical protein
MTLALQVLSAYRAAPDRLGISENRRAVPWRIVISGVLLMIVMALLLLKVPLFKQFFLALNDALLGWKKRRKPAHLLYSVTSVAASCRLPNCRKLQVSCSRSALAADIGD